MIYGEEWYERKQNAIGRKKGLSFETANGPLQKVEIQSAIRKR